MNKILFYENDGEGGGGGGGGGGGDILDSINFSFNLDPLCINIKITLSVNDDPPLIIDEIINVSNLINNSITFPRIGIDTFTFINNDIVHLSISQGLQYPPNGEIVYTDPTNLDGSIVDNAPPNITLPDITASTILSSNKKLPTVHLELTKDDTMDRIKYNFTVSRGMNLSPIYDSGVLTFTNKIDINYIQSGSNFQPNNIFPKNVLIVGDLLNITITVGLNLDPTNPNSDNIKWGDSQIIAYTVDTPKPPKPDQPIAVPVISLYQD